MSAHLRANLWLLGLTILVCSILYPLTLLGIGQAVFPSAANGSLITDQQGKLRGSRLIAQPFSADKYFHPRPSAVSYNAAATGGSNLGASAPALRERVVGQLGSLVKYGPDGPRPGEPIGPDIEAWYRASVAEKKIEPAAEGTDIPSAYFEAWLAEHRDVDLEDVPSDLVTASGSGLDPDITLTAALWQLDRVAAARAKETGNDPATLREQIEQLLRAKSRAPLAGLAGAPLVNVLEVNLALRERFEKPARGQE